MPPTVLLVSFTDALYVEMLRRDFSSMGFRVTTAVGAEEALAKVALFNPSAVYVEFSDQVEGSWEIVEDLRDLPSLHQYQVVALLRTGRAGRDATFAGLAHAHDIPTVDGPCTAARLLTVVTPSKPLPMYYEAGGGPPGS